MQTNNRSNATTSMFVIILLEHLLGILRDLQDRTVCKDLVIWKARMDFQNILYFG